MKVVITIPAYNEENTLGPVIDDIKQVMGKYDYQILVVDDGSVDKTVKVAREKGAVVFSHPRNLGLAEAFKTEMQKCIEMKADVIVHTDADGQYPAKYIPQLIAGIKDADLVIGSRFEKNGKYKGHIMNKIGNEMFAKALSGLLKMKIADTTSGFRAFTPEVAKLPLINSFTYTQEQLIRVCKAKMKIITVPIETMKTRKSRLFKSPGHYALRAWLNIFRIYRDFDPLKFFGFIGLFFVFVGFLLGVWIIYNLAVFGRVGGIPRVILAGLFITTGIQVILFGFLADMTHR